jgi:CHAT domain
MGAAADLELSLRRQGDGYAVETRFRLTPTSPEVDLLAGQRDLPLVRLDEQRLLEHGIDPDLYGHYLATQLSEHTALGKAIQSARAQAEAKGVPLRLRLRLDAGDPKLHTVRWELLGDLEHPEAPVALNERLLLSRFIASSDLSPVTLQPSGELRALIAVANPSDPTQRYHLAPIAVDDEVERARRVLEGQRIHVDVLASKDDTVVTLATLAERLRTEPDIFYLVAHGALMRDSGAPYLWLQNDQGAPNAAKGEDLVTMLRNLQRRPTLTILASCESAGDGHRALVAVGPSLVAAGLPAVIAMQGKVSMATIAQFIPSFCATCSTMARSTRPSPPPV